MVGLLHLLLTLLALAVSAKSRPFALFQVQNYIKHGSFEAEPYLDDDMKLLFAFEINRHGARTPV